MQFGSLVPQMFLQMRFLQTEQCLGGHRFKYLTSSVMKDKKKNEKTLSKKEVIGELGKCLPYEE